MAVKLRKTSQDLDQKAIRCRLSMQIYDPESQMYRGSADLSLRLSVDTKAEMKRLWGAIGKLLKEGVKDDRDPTHSRPDGDLPAVSAT